MDTKALTPTIAVDFDGTLCKEAWPDIGDANWPLINFLIKWRKQGKKVILWTCRENEMLSKAVTWCAGHGLFFDAVNENLKERIEAYGNDSRKIGADYYIDDSSTLIVERGHMITPRCKEMWV